MLFGTAHSWLLMNDSMDCAIYIWMYWTTRGNKKEATEESFGTTLMGSLYCSLLKQCVHGNWQIFIPVPCVKSYGCSCQRWIWSHSRWTHESRNWVDWYSSCISFHFWEKSARLAPTSRSSLSGGNPRSLRYLRGGHRLRISSWP